MWARVELTQLKSQRHFRVLEVRCVKHQAVPNLLIDISKIIQTFNMLSFVFFLLMFIFNFK